MPADPSRRAVVKFRPDYNHTQLWQQLHRCNRNLIAFQKKKRASMRGNQIPKLGDDVIVPVLEEPPGEPYVLRSLRTHQTPQHLATDAASVNESETRRASKDGPEDDEEIFVSSQRASTRDAFSDGRPG